MKITVKERADSHGSQVTHHLDFKEGLHSILIHAFHKEVTVNFSTRVDPYVLKLTDPIDSIKIDDYSV